MFARIKNSCRCEYMQTVENRTVGVNTVQRVICTIGRMDQVHAKGSIQTLVRSLSRFSEKVLLILSNKRDVSASGEKIGPCLIFGRLWKELGIKKVTKDILADRKFEFDVERAIFSLYFIGSLPLDLTGPVINGAGSM